MYLLNLTVGFIVSLLLSPDLTLSRYLLTNPDTRDPTTQTYTLRVRVIKKKDRHLKKKIDILTGALFDREVPVTPGPTVSETFISFSFRTNDVNVRR